MQNTRKVRIIKTLVSCLLILTMVVSMQGFEIAYAEEKSAKEEYSFMQDDNKNKQISKVELGNKNYLNNLDNKDETYEEYLPYDKEIIQAYDNFTDSLTKKNKTVYICLEDFAEYYKTGNVNKCFEINSEIEKSVVDTEKREKFEVQNEKEIESIKSSSGSDKYYYDIGNDPSQKPVYSKYSILQVAKKGDIILDKEGSWGLTGHAAIVEGIFKSPKHGCYYVKLIEAVKPGGVCHGLLDDVRADERDSVLYKVFVASEEQKRKAVLFCYHEIGAKWGGDLSHNYQAGQHWWLCSQLVWAGYKNQGIDIECNSSITPGAAPYDITERSEKTTKVELQRDYHPIKDGTYYITNCKSNLRLDVNGNIADSTQIQQYNVGNYADQKWIFTYNSEGRYYTIKSAASNNNYYLDVASPSSGLHAKVKLWHTNSNLEEKWYIYKSGKDGNKYCFINCYNYMCMDISGGSTNNGADVQIYRYTGSEDQKWMISLCGTKVIPDGKYYITNSKSGLRLGVEGGVPGKSVQIKQYNSTSQNNQKWYIEWNEAWTCYYIVNSDLSNGGYYLDVASPSSGAHAKVKLWNSKTRPEERWVIVSTGNGTYKFINGYDGLCMDIQGGSTSNGADVQVYPYEGSADQKWKLQKV